MKAAFLGNGGRLVVGEIPRPQLGKGEVLIRTLLCGLCGSDLYKIRNGSVPQGTVLGHEVVGVIETCPEELRESFPPGARVTVSNHVPCGCCEDCLRGRISSCKGFRSTSIDPGGFAELVRIPRTHIPHALMRIPDRVDDIHAILAEPLGCCLRAVERWPVGPRGRVLVVGLGPMGILMSLVLSQAGARVTGVEPLAERRDLARSKGCEMVCSPQEVDILKPFDGVVITVSTEETLRRALGLVRPGGWIGLFAGPSRGDVIQVPLQTIYKEEIDILPSYSTGPNHMRKALEMMEKGVLDLGGIVTQVLPIEDIQRAVEMAESRVGIKTVLRF